MFNPEMFNLENLAYAVLVAVLSAVILALKKLRKAMKAKAKPGGTSAPPGALVVLLALSLLTALPLSSCSSFSASDVRGVASQIFGPDSLSRERVHRFPDTLVVKVIHDIPQPDSSGNDVDNN